MAQLKDFGDEIIISTVPGGGTDPATTELDGVYEVGELGKAHFQIDHDFNNDNVVIFPKLSVDGVNFTPIHKFDERIEVALSSSPTAFILTDLVPGTKIKLGTDFADQESGSLTIKTAG